jgi:hypothetical protein
MISDNNTNIIKNSHVSALLFLHCSKNSDHRSDTFLQNHDSENFFRLNTASEGVSTSSEGVPQTLLDYLSARHHAYIEWIHYICIFNSCYCEGKYHAIFWHKLFLWVCDNLATGRICKDKTLFIGDLVPSIYIVRAATGTLEPTLMSTVQLRITDNNGKKHTFTLTHVN